MTYLHYLIPEDNTYRPGPDDLSRLVAELVRGGFAPATGMGGHATGLGGPWHYPEANQTGCVIELGHPAPEKCHSFPSPATTHEFAELDRREYNLVWPVKSSQESGLNYPLTPFPELDGDVYYEIQIHIAQIYVYITSEMIDPFCFYDRKVSCQCGQNLESYYEEKCEIFDEFRYIGSQCPSCGALFRPQDLLATIRDIRTGDSWQRPGGATSRFAVVIDCSNCFSGKMQATPAFLELVTQTLGQVFYQVDDGY